jgi:membrane-bound metal-dependent hydrolase YbcI (DUF457 family)
MPFTPYHFGPSGFVALTFRKWLDPPVFVLANVVIDVEVLIIRLFGFGLPVHRFCHTFLIGAAAGLLWGLAAWPLRRFFIPVMRVLRVPYRPALWRMLLAGALGVWLHILIDAFYHMDVSPFWPSKTSLFFMVQHRLGKPEIESICLFFLAAAIVPYVVAVFSFYRSKKGHGLPAPAEKDHGGARP